MAENSHHERAIKFLAYIQKRGDFEQSGQPEPLVKIRYQNLWEDEQLRFQIYGHIGKQGQYFSEVVLFKDGTWRFLA